VVGVGRVRQEALILKCCMLIRAEGPREGAVGVRDAGSSYGRWREWSLVVEIASSTTHMHEMPWRCVVSLFEANPVLGVL
jgi:hypothetical protein